MSLVILADIGGTNTRVALAEGTRVLPDTIRRFSNADYSARGQDIADILRDFLAEAGARAGAKAGAGVVPEGVCVAAAGPVQEGVAVMTNLSWVIDEAKLTQATGAARVRILNDLQAQGHALGHIAPDNLRPLIAPLGEMPAKGTMLVVGLGTGVNAAPVHGVGADRVVPPSECGHINMPVRSAEDLRLMAFIEAMLAEQGEIAHCGVEEVLAGRGLGNLYAFAAAEAGQSQRLDSAAVLAALAQEDPLAIKAAQLYTRILAQVLADQALIHLPWGGLYLIGGMARAMTPHLQRFDLAGQFRQARRVDLLTKDFSVHVVEDDFAALTGCAAWLEASR